ncbi:nitrate- and nitrite sensing domain-containing protein [Streptomyces sp. ODS28]|uniref:sensor histidine kinase n=1 Tax=Streptomyces sp. ODS28 TaxID=3136688 RepID=UPI0031F01CDD
MSRSTTGSAPQARGQERGNFTPPSRDAAPASSGDAGRSGGGGKRRFSARNWRVPTRLNAILLIPVLVALVLGGFRVNDAVSTWNEAEDAQATAELVEAAATYGNALIDERDRTAEPLLTGQRGDSEVDKARAATDQAKQQFDKAAQNMPDKPGLKRRLHAFRQEEPKLEKLRQAAFTRKLGGTKTEELYVTVQHPLMEFANELGFGTGNVTSYGRTVYSVSLAKAAASLQRSLGTHLLVKPGPSAKEKKQQLTSFASYAYLERIAIEEYVGGGRPEDVRLLKDELAKAKAKGKKDTEAARHAARAKGAPFVTPPPMSSMVTAIGSGAGSSSLRAKGITQDSWFATATGKFDAYRSVEKELAQNAVGETQQIASDAKRDAILNGILVLAALLLAFVVAGRMARSMSHSMRSLRTAAFDVAEQRLPAIVDQLSRTDPGRVDTRVEPIPIDSRDEIGEVARAFDQVHREAVRLASEQAMLRGNVNAIFTNLSRRNQGLIERQLGLITDLENNEADPDQLESLFRLDHLATRMRRNGENLLVLAGEEPGRRWVQPVPLVDILRAASSEVEEYERIELSGVPESEIHGQVVNDLVHLLAELLENATSFSSPQTKVQVTATRLPDGRVMIEIHDKGIGLTAEDFADINHKLANPPVVDATVSQRMGLFVVGRLAGRHSIRVQLRPAGKSTGTTSLVMLPEEITHGGGGDEGAEEDFTVSRIMPERPQGPAEPGMRTAAELGFDDSRYGTPEVPDDLSSLDPVGRSLLREGRRAALEAQQGGGAGEFGQDQAQEQSPGTQQGPQGPSGAAGAPAPEQEQPQQQLPQQFQGQFPQVSGGQQQIGQEYPGLEPGHELGQEPGQYQPGPQFDQQPGQQSGQQLGQFPGGQPGPGQHAEEQPPQHGAQDVPGQAPYGQGQDQGGFPSADPYGFGAGTGAGADAGALGRNTSAQDALRQDPFGQGTLGGQDPQGLAGPAPQDPYGQPQQPLYERQYGSEQSPYEPQAESVPGVPDADMDRVGFDRPGPSSSGFSSTTGAGLPRRQAAHPLGDGGPDAAQHAQPEPAAEEQAPWDDGSGALGTGLESGWRSANDERWDRAGRLRDPQAGGVTSSGLPRRVPRANLVEGTAEQSPQGGPSVSRAPEDVRGRLSNLHRGVRKGRTAGDAHQNDQQGFGPGSTYDQER